VVAEPPTKKPSSEDFGLPAHGGTLSADDQNRIEQGIAEKVRSYGIDKAYAELAVGRNQRSGGGRP
jgi:hypothetical protein